MKKEEVGKRIAETWYLVTHVCNLEYLYLFFISVLN